MKHTQPLFAFRMFLSLFMDYPLNETAKTYCSDVLPVSIIIKSEGVQSIHNKLFSQIAVEQSIEQWTVKYFKSMGYCAMLTYNTGLHCINFPSFVYRVHSHAFSLYLFPLGWIQTQPVLQQLSLERHTWGPIRLKQLSVAIQYLFVRWLERPLLGYY